MDIRAFFIVFSVFLVSCSGTEEPDSDGDGVVDSVDAFPLNSDEQLDSDKDGIGDNADMFPNDANEQIDTDNDGVGDNSDAFPFDAAEQQDTDGDGVGDNKDAFPTDPSEQFDTDGDGLGDNADVLNRVNLHYLVTREGQFTSFLYNQLTDDYRDIKIQSAPSSFVLSSSGRFELATQELTSGATKVVITGTKNNRDLILEAVFTLFTDPIIDGYASKQVANSSRLTAGLSNSTSDVINLHINAQEVATQELYITDINNRIVATKRLNYQNQEVRNAKPWLNGFGYSVSTTVSMADFSSGVYFVNGSEKIYFSVKNPNKNSPISLVLPTNTQNAYSCAGGRSLYNCKVAGKKMDKVPTVSFLRPQVNPDTSPWGTHVIKLTKPFLSWLYNESEFASQVQYLADSDLEDATEFKQSKLLIIPGHNEYWSIPSQDNFTEYLDSGHNALVAGGNIMWWHSRFEQDMSRITSVKWPPESDTLAVKGEETTYFHKLKDKDGHTRAAHHTIGGLFSFGGYNQNKWDNSSKPNAFRVIRPNSKVFNNTGFNKCDELDLSDNLEFDGALITGFDENGFPHVNYKQYKYIHNFEILAYTWAHYGKYHKVATVHALQRKASSGTSLQIGSIGAASFGFSNAQQSQYKIFLTNAVKMLLEGSYQFESDTLYRGKQKSGFSFPYEGPKKTGFEACEK